MTNRFNFLVIHLFLSIVLMASIGCRNSEDPSVPNSETNRTPAIIEMSYVTNDGRRSTSTSLLFKDATLLQTESTMGKDSENRVALNPNQLEKAHKLQEHIMATGVLHFKDSYEPEINAKDATYHSIVFNMNTTTKTIEITEATLPAELVTMLNFFWKIVKEGN